MGTSTFALKMPKRSKNVSKPPKIQFHPPSTPIFSFKGLPWPPYFPHWDPSLVSAHAGTMVFEMCSSGPFQLKPPTEEVGPSNASHPAGDKVPVRSLNVKNREAFKGENRGGWRVELDFGWFGDVFGPSDSWMQCHKAISIVERI